MKVFLFTFLFFFVVLIDARPENSVLNEKTYYEEALLEITKKCPQEIAEKQAVIEVKFYGFDDIVHTGHLVADYRLAGEIQDLFRKMIELKFPVGSVIPESNANFNWNEDVPISKNNSSSFDYRLAVGRSNLSMHAFGQAIDINPGINPYIKGKTIRPPGSHYDPSKPGSFTNHNPVVNEFRKRGWTWGGDWGRVKDYHHFEKEPDETNLVNLRVYKWSD